MNEIIRMFDPIKIEFGCISIYQSFQTKIPNRNSKLKFPFQNNHDFQKSDSILRHYFPLFLGWFRIRNPVFPTFLETHLARTETNVPRWNHAGQQKQTPRSRSSENEVHGPRHEVQKTIRRRPAKPDQRCRNETLQKRRNGRSTSAHRDEFG